MRAVVPLVFLTAVAACGKAPDFVYEGVPFQTKVQESKEDDRVFTVAVTPALTDPKGAKEAARWEATRYCIKEYGSSDVDWQIGPAVADDALTVVEGKAIFKGKCLG